jgi:hypothetical protein
VGLVVEVVVLFLLQNCGCYLDGLLDSERLVSCSSVFSYSWFVEQVMSAVLGQLQVRSKQMERRIDAAAREHRSIGLRSTRRGLSALGL